MALDDEKARRITRDELDRVKFIADFTDRMKHNERDFIVSVMADIERWGERTFFSIRQVAFLESLESRYI